MKEYEVRDEEAKQQVQQVKQEVNHVKQENARMRLMYDLDRTAHNREAAALQERLRELEMQRDEALKKAEMERKQRDEALKKAEEERKVNRKLAQMAKIGKLTKEQDTSDDSAIIEDDAPDGQSSNSDPSTVVIMRNGQDKVQNFVIFSLFPVSVCLVVTCMLFVPNVLLPRSRVSMLYIIYGVTPAPGRLCLH